MLHKGGLTRYARIVGVYRFRDLSVLEFMLSALAVGAVLIAGAALVGLGVSAPPPPIRLLTNVLGGLLFGVGMATAGFCPGTVVAEAGEGRLDAIVAGGAGLGVGALLFGLLHPWFAPTLSRVGDFGRVTFADLTGASPLLLAVIFAELVVLGLLALRHAKPSDDKDVHATPKEAASY